ncbi:MAG: YwaF family protein [Clostridia bacterium]|nr:YwaF family protein [Clostridia bacterium]
MTWGTFGAVHIITIILTAVLNVALYFILKYRSPRTQWIVLGVLSFAGVAAIIFNLLTWGSPLEYLPLHLCSLNAMVLPFAVWFKSEKLGNLLLLWSLGALFAIIVNDASADFELLSWTFVFYYFPHVLELGIPILMMKLGLVKLKAKCVITTVIITMASYTAIHFINVLINDHCLTNGVTNPSGEIIQVNYMFSITPANPLLQLFYQIIPYEYWYMYLVVPVVVLYLGAIYLTHHFVTRNKSKHTVTEP